MAAVIYEDPRQRDRRLAQYFNSTRDQWIEVVKASVGARGGCTTNNARSAPGFYAWDAGVARMRQIFCKEGWETGCEDGIELIVSRELGKKITVMNSDAGTADNSRSPKNRTLKGSATEKVADLNNQIEMFKSGDISKIPEDVCAIWNLCIFDDGKQVRAELSRPMLFRSGYFVKFSERIFILRDGDWEKVAIGSTSPEAEQTLEINVRRK
jgi:hypothetical protein